jgi:pyruvate dehydrogenase E2 component (dihydrolipoamide acetyltransferase)
MESTSLGESLEICVPDIGDFDEVEVVELLVAKGDTVEVEDPLVSVESDKATMEIPSTAAGLVVELRVSEGDRVSEGSVLLVLEIAEATSPRSPTPTVSHDGAEEAAATAPPPSSPEPGVDGPRDSETSDSVEVERPAPVAKMDVPPARQISPAARLPVPDRSGLPHASPLVRRYARELGVPIGTAEGSGPHGRVLVD